MKQSHAARNVGRLLVTVLLMILATGALAEPEQARIVELLYEREEVLSGESPATLEMSDEEFILESEALSLEADRLRIGETEVIVIDRLEIDGSIVEVINHKTIGSIIHRANGTPQVRFEITVNWFRPLEVTVMTRTPVPAAGRHVGVEPGSLRIVEGGSIAIWRYRSEPRAYTILELPGDWRRIDQSTSFAVAGTDIIAHIVELQERPYGRGDDYVGSLDILEEGKFADWNTTRSAGKSNMGEYTYASSISISPDETRMLAYTDIRPNIAFPLLIYAEAEIAAQKELMRVIWGGPKISYAQ